MTEQLTESKDKSRSRQDRSSNIELMRILLMFFIIAHHSIVNSGILSSLDSSVTLSANAVVLRLWGMWGKTCINAFVMVTGYFMCTRQLNWVKVVKLLGEIYFYKIVIALIFLGTGLMDASGFVNSLIGTFRWVNGSFTSSYLIMYFSIPFLNKLLANLDRGGVAPSHSALALG